MRIFALETDVTRFKEKFLHEAEREELMVFNHGFKFFMAVLRLLPVTLLIVGVAVAVGVGGVAHWTVSSVAALLALLVFVFPRLLRAFIDWRYDFTFITTDKVVLVDQSSLFRQRVTPINLENFASVSTETQFWNLFSFGKLKFHLKSGLGQDVVLPYIGGADEIAARIANIVTDFQRRKDLRRIGGVPDREG